MAAATSAAGAAAIPRSVAWQLGAVYASIAADIVVTAITDPLGSRDSLAHVLLLALQVSLALAVLLSFFLLASSVSPWARLGLYDAFARRHCGTFLTGGVAVALVGGRAGLRLALAAQGADDVWGAPGYLPLWAACRVALLGFHVSAAAATAAPFAHARACGWLPAEAAGQRRRQQRQRRRLQLQREQERQHNASVAPLPYQFQQGGFVVVGGGGGGGGGEGGGGDGVGLGCL